MLCKVVNNDCFLDRGAPESLQNFEALVNLQFSIT